MGQARKYPRPTQDYQFGAQRETSQTHDHQFGA